MITNPNQRGWRYQNLFIDLERVALVVYEDGTLSLYMDSMAADDSIDLDVSADVAKSLIDALEIYRSNA